MLALVYHADDRHDADVGCQPLRQFRRVERLHVVGTERAELVVLFQTAERDEAQRKH